MVIESGDAMDAVRDRAEVSALVAATKRDSVMSSTLFVMSVDLA